MEHTYAGKNHRSRPESVEDLIGSIYKTTGNVLIPAFAQQRTQELMMTLAEEAKKNPKFLDHFEILVDSPLSEKVTKLYFKFA